MSLNYYSLSGIYILYVVFFPLAAFFGIREKSDKTANILFDKKDTLYLRGVSACFVMLAHFCIWLNELNVGINKLFYFVISQLGGIGVLIFFFASGYGIYESYADRQPSHTYLLKRGGGIYLPYLMIKLFLLGITFATDTHSEIKIKDFISIITVEDWFIRVILIKYIVFYIIWRFLGKEKIISYSIASDFVISIVFVIQHKPDRWFNALWLFTFGMACSLYKGEIIKFFNSRIWIKTSLLFTAFTIFGIVFAVNKGSYWADIFKPVSGACLCTAIYGIMSHKEFSSPIMLYLGKRSMYLYIVHINVWQMVNLVNPLERFWIVFLTTLILTEAIYYINKKMISILSNIYLIIRSGSVKCW